MRHLRSTLGGNRDLRLLLVANLVSLTGDWVLRTGLAYQIYVLTGSTLASAGAVLASLLPQLALGSVAGVYADRWDRRRTMIVTNLLMAAALLPLLAVQNAGRAWLVYAVIAAQSCLAPFFTSAEAALVPTIAGTTHPAPASTETAPPPTADAANHPALTSAETAPTPATSGTDHPTLTSAETAPGPTAAADQLVTVNSLNGQVRDVGRLIGAALGGVVAGHGGIVLLSIVDMATFALAAVLLFLIRARRTPGPATRLHVLRDWAEGLRIATAAPALRVFLAFTLITGAGEAILGTLMAPFVRDVLGGGPGAYGMIMATQAVGGLVGGAVITLAGHRCTPRALFGWGAVAFGALDLAIFLYPLLTRALWPALTLIALVGLPAAALVAGGMTIFQQATDDRTRGRVFGAFTAVDGAAMLLGTLAAGTLGERIGILPVITAQGALYCLAGALVLVALPRPAPVRPELTLAA